MNMAIASAALALLLAGGVAACGGSTSGTQHHGDGGGGVLGGGQGDKPNSALFAAGCPLVDEAVVLRVPAARKPIVAAIDRLKKQVKIQSEADFLMHAAVVAQAQGLPNVSYPPQDKTALIRECAQHGHPLRNVK